MGTYLDGHTIPGALQIGIILVDIAGEAKVGDLADFAIGQKHIACGQIAVNQLEKRGRW